MIACGYFHSICLDYDGIAYSFGRNNEGQLGIGKSVDELSFTHLPQQLNIPICRQVSCGDFFTTCLTEDNRLYSCGKNINGQLGIGGNHSPHSPQLIPDFYDVEYVVGGSNFSICKTYNNHYYSWGINKEGQLGQGNNNHCNKPIQCLNWPDNIITIKTCISHSLLLTSEGQVYSFGANYNGQLGIDNMHIKSINEPTLINDIPEMKRIEYGYNFSMCIDINDSLWVFGNNEYGQLGLADKKHRYKPIQHPTLSNIIDISSVGYNTFAKTSDNKIFAFGNNKFSQLGIKTSEESQSTPIQLFQDNEDIWSSTIGKSRQKSARK